MLFDKFKNIIHKEKAEKKSEEPVGLKKKKVVLKAAAEKNILKPNPNVGKKNNVFIYEIIKRPMITEKGSLLGQDNKYLLRVYKNSSKPEIKKAVKELYNITVKDVNIINIPRKKRQRGKSQGFKSGFKKAIVTLKQGDKIELA